MIGDKRMHILERRATPFARLRAGLKRRFGWLGAAEAARRSGDLPVAIAAYEAYLGKEPRDAAATLRLARVLDDAGRVRDALAATRRSLMLRPSHAQAEALRDRLEQDLGEAVSPDRGDVRPLSVEAYPIWRQEPTPAPPAGPRPRVLAFVAAPEAAGGALDLTLASLKHAGLGGASVIVGPQLASGIRQGLAGCDIGFLLYIRAGTVLAPAALDWLAYAATRPGAVGAVGDHEIADSGSDDDLASRSPRLHGQPSWMERQAVSAHYPVILIDSAALRAEIARAPDRPLSACVDALFARDQQAARLVHAPLVLSVLAAANAGFEANPESRDAPDAVSPPSILVVIPTKDRVKDLRIMIDSLLRLASHPNTLRIRVVDNRSREPETLAYLRQGRDNGVFDVLVCDEPFNWSRLNNLAAFGNEPIILFANNDMMVESRGWDMRLRRDLGQADIGVVGAKLTYPTGSLQHGGVLLGGNGERPFHEGVGIPPGIWAAHPRWDHRRIAAAVTGAFMGMRREVFEAVGRFNEDLPIAYNDVDMCLRVRAAGFHVLYDPALHATHAESLTRGKIVTSEEQRVDDEHFQILKAAWPRDHAFDPGVSPCWAPVPLRPFRYLIHPSRERILAWIDQVQSDPWLVHKP